MWSISNLFHLWHWLAYDAVGAHVPKLSINVPPTVMCKLTGQIVNRVVHVKCSWFLVLAHKVDPAVGMSCTLA